MAPSYWTFRRNQYEDLARLLASNTVTGAAAILRRSLLDHALPFPQALGESYHDHYLACAALAFGTIGYVDDVLYDYVQTGRNVTGHVVQARYSPFPPGAVRALLHPRSRKDAFIRIRQSLLDYHLGYTKLQLTSKLLRDRGSRHPALKLFDGTGYSIPRLMREWLRNLTSRTDERFNLGYFLASRATRQATQWYLTAIRSFRRRRGTGKCSASKRA